MLVSSVYQSRNRMYLYCLPEPEVLNLKGNQAKKNSGTGPIDRKGIIYIYINKDSQQFFSLFRARFVKNRRFLKVANILTWALTFCVWQTDVKNMAGISNRQICYVRSQPFFCSSLLMSETI